MVDNEEEIKKQQDSKLIFCFSLLIFVIFAEFGHKSYYYNTKNVYRQCITPALSNVAVCHQRAIQNES